MKIDYIILQKNVMSRGLRKVALCATVCENTKRPAMPSFYLIITGLFCFCHLKVPHKLMLRYNRCGAPTWAAFFLLCLLFLGAGFARLAGSGCFSYRCRQRGGSGWRQEAACAECTHRIENCDHRNTDISKYRCPH